MSARITRRRRSRHIGRAAILCIFALVISTFVAIGNAEAAGRNYNRSPIAPRSQQAAEPKPAVRPAPRTATQAPAPSTRFAVTGGKDKKDEEEEEEAVVDPDVTVCLEQGNEWVWKTIKQSQLDGKTVDATIASEEACEALNDSEDTGGGTAVFVYICHKQGNSWEWKDFEDTSISAHIGHGDRQDVDEEGCLALNDDTGGGGEDPVFVNACVETAGVWSWQSVNEDDLAGLVIDATATTQTLCEAKNNTGGGQACPWNPDFSVGDAECFEPCQYDSSISADSIDCVEPRCQWNESIAASDAACVEPSSCQWNAQLLASDPLCVDPGIIGIPKTNVCHDNNGYSLIEVDESELGEHLAHGDEIGLTEAACAALNGAACPIGEVEGPDGICIDEGPDADCATDPALEGCPVKGETEGPGGGTGGVGGVDNGGSSGSGGSGGSSSGGSAGGVGGVGAGPVSNGDAGSGGGGVAAAASDAPGAQAAASGSRRDPTGELPFTGFEERLLAGLGLLLVLTGAGLHVGARRREAA